MRIRNRISEFFYYFIIGLMTAFSLAYNSLLATVLEIDINTVVFFSLIFITAFYVLFFNKYTIILTLVSGGIAAVVVFINLWRSGFEASWFVALSADVNEIAMFAVGALPYKPEYSFILTVLIVFLMSFIVASTIRTKYGFYIISVLGALTIGIPAIKNWGKSGFSILMLVFCIIVLFLEKLNSLASGKGGEDIHLNTSYALLVVPLALVVLFTATRLPKPDESRIDVLSAVRNSDFFRDKDAVEVLNFSENNSRLGGPITMGEEFVMEVEMDEPFYLNGIIRDTYTGNSWTLSDNSREFLAEDFQKIYALNKPMPSVIEDERSYKVSIGPNRTHKIYSPNYPVTVEKSDDVGLMTNNTGEFWTRRPLKENSTYTIKYIPQSFSNPQFLAAINSGFENAITDPSQTERYLQLPDNLPQRIVELAEDITKDYDTSYEKLLAIMTYLRQFPYTLEPDIVPEDRDFVDYFLFDGKEGYCVYYATAMVVMSRAIGIPARYVEGFTMPQQRNENGNFSVTNAQAHAWPQIYFPSYGWVNFEPTAAYDATRYQQLAQEVSQLEEESPEPPPEVQDATTEENPIPPVQEETPPQKDNPDNSKLEKNEDVTTGDTVSATGEKHSSGLVKALKLVFILALVLGAGYLLVRLRADSYKKKLAKIENSDSKAKVVGYYKYILKANAALGRPVGENETPQKYARRIKDEQFTQLAELFSEAYYSENEITQQDSQMVKDYYQSLLEKLKRQEKLELFFLARRYVLWQY